MFKSSQETQGLQQPISLMPQISKVLKQRQLVSQGGVQKKDLVQDRRFQGNVQSQQVIVGGVQQLIQQQQLQQQQQQEQQQLYPLYQQYEQNFLGGGVGLLGTFNYGVYDQQQDYGQEEIFLEQVKQVLEEPKVVQKKKDSQEDSLKDFELEQLKQKVRSRLEKSQLLEVQNMKQGVLKQEEVQEEVDQENEEDEQQDDLQEDLQESKGGGGVQRYKKKRVLKVWIPEEDKLLLFYQQKLSGKWDKIAEQIPGRNASQCAQRYRRLNPQRVRAHWTEEEDEIVRKMVKKFGRNWGLIASNLEGRNGKQVRERYINCLDTSINWQTFSKQEDKIIWEFYKANGAKWSELAKKLRGRPENMIKNRYYAHLKRLSEIHGNEYLRELDSMPAVEITYPPEQEKKEQEENLKRKNGQQEMDDKLQKKHVPTKNKRLGKVPKQEIQEDDEEEEFNEEQHLIKKLEYKKNKLQNILKQKIRQEQEEIEKYEEDEEAPQKETENVKQNLPNNFLTKQNGTVELSETLNHFQQLQNTPNAQNNFLPQHEKITPQQINTENKEPKSGASQKQMCLKIEKEDENGYNKYTPQGPFSALKSPFNNYSYHPNPLTPNLKSSDYKAYGGQNSKEKNEFLNQPENQQNLHTPDIINSAQSGRNSSRKIIFNFNENENNLFYNTFFDTNTNNNTPLLPFQYNSLMSPQINHEFLFKTQANQQQQQQQILFQQQQFQQLQQQVQNNLSNLNNNNLNNINNNLNNLNNVNNKNNYSNGQAANNNFVNNFASNNPLTPNAHFLNNEINKKNFIFNTGILNSGYPSPSPRQQNLPSPGIYTPGINSAIMNPGFQSFNWSNLGSANNISNNQIFFNDDNNIINSQFRQPEIKPENKIKAPKVFNFNNAENSSNETSTTKNENQKNIKKKELKLIVTHNETKDEN